MACFFPLHGYRSRTKNESGKYSIVFNPRHGYIDQPQTVPCGQCSGCRLERSRQWAVRCVHEASLHDTNSFVTLTYDDDHLPNDGSLDLSHFQKFMKRLRKKFGKLRYYHCGEYGDETNRPHYHSLLFGLDFADKKFWKQTSNGDNLYVSETLNNIWGKGFCPIGDVTFQSAAYVARYIMKKITGSAADEHYDGKLPEYTSMSRRPGIGTNWYEKYSSDVFPEDFVILNAKKFRPPKFYDKLLEKDDIKTFDKLKLQRQIGLSKYASNNTPERLEIRREIQDRKLELLPRSIA